MADLKIDYFDSIAHNIETLRSSKKLTYEKELIALRKQKYFYDHVSNLLPDDLKKRISCECSPLSSNWIIIYLQPDLSSYSEHTNDELEEERKKITIELVDWGVNLKRFSFKKKFSSYNGQFRYEMCHQKKPSASYRSNTWDITIRHAANIDGCKVTKKERMQTVYESDCDD